MAANPSKRLLVEGTTDLCAIAEIAEGNGVKWSTGNEPVTIKVLGTKTPPKGDVAAELKVDPDTSVGIILDADDDLLGTWKTIQKWLQPHVSNLPTEIPREGFVSIPDSQRRIFGAWIMPDNCEAGTLETLLKQLVRPESSPVLKHAQQASDSAKTLGAPFNETHREKAEIFTWLAWQDEPGRNFKTIDFQEIFDAKADAAQPFVKWFRKLFEL